MFKLFRPFLKIDPREVEFARRGFACAQPHIQARLERVGQVFLQGYHAGLKSCGGKHLATLLDETEWEFRGFAYEGAAMALALADGISLRGNQLPQFIADGGKQHIYMMHVGAGWACARLPWLRNKIEAVMAKFNPVLRWLIMDGYGFHEGYFHFSRAEGGALRLSPAARHVFYQGLGRSLWFVNGANALLIARSVASFAPQYHSDAWSGVGLACAYAGGRTVPEITELQAYAAPHGPALAQGAAFAAKARHLAGNSTRHTEAACMVLCGMRATEAASLCDETLRQVSTGHPCPYQQWRELLWKIFSCYSDMHERGKFHESIYPSRLASAKPN